jgi:hypothetical protein
VTDLQAGGPFSARFRWHNDCSIAAIENRKHVRAAPTGCSLQVKPRGFLGFLSSNLAEQWIDVSESGIGVLLVRPVKVGARLRVRLMHDVYRQAFDVMVDVQHVRESASRPGLYVVGCQFVAPSPVMRVCIRSVVDTGRLPSRKMVSGFLRAS